jgi:hypothetical protein
MACRCCSTSTCAQLPANVEANPYGLQICALVGPLGSALPLKFQQNPGLAQSAAGRGVQLRGDCRHPPALKRSVGRKVGRSGGDRPSAAGGLRR